MRAEQRTSPLKGRRWNEQCAPPELPASPKAVQELAKLSSLPMAIKWLPIPTMVRTQQVLSEMEAAEPQGFPLPLSCVFRHCSSAEEQQLILCQRVKRDVHQVQG